MNFMFLAAIIAAYLVGAIPVGYIIARIKGVQDIRNHGSGNIGATNVSRLLGLPYFFLIFFLDAGKAFLFIYIARYYFSVDEMYLFSLVLLFGNAYSLFLNGSGGKGVATLLGLLAALSMPAAVFCVGVWCLFVLLTNTVGIASVGATLCVPIFAFILYGFAIFTIFSCCAAVWIMFTHRSNVWRYWNGVLSKKAPFL